ncbi:MAG TPA: beta-N-acetylhexosaminidase [Nitrospiraceae bacterium]|jgi:beta-N-acetylhexosaminidase|nr:beta-N-acetylhexosaminidase [Nitrospiraceae bacterium]
MALREKVGQLFMAGFSGTAASKDVASLVTDYKPSGVILFSRNLEALGQIVQLTNDLQKLSPGSPLLIAIDQEGGRVSRLPAEFTLFPPCAVLGACRSYDLAYAVAATTAAELRAVGINMNMAPVLDVNSNPANPVIGDRAFGSDPRTVCEMGQATVAGLQDNEVIACGKHFPGHGDTAADSHKELPVVEAPVERLREIELPPFRYAIAHGVATLMTAHVLYRAWDPRWPATLSPTILTTLLRGEMGFEGVVLTDDLEMRAIIDHYGVEEAAVRAFLAGADMLLICQDPARTATAVRAMERAVEDGTIPAGRLEISLERIARLKRRFLSAYKPISLADAKLVVGCRTHKALLDSIRQARERLLKAQA